MRRVLRRLTRWTVRLVLGALALSLVAVCVVLVAVHTDWGREQIRARAEAALQDAFPGARIGALEGSVLGELVVRDVDLPAAPGVPFLAAGALRVEVALSPLLGKTIRVDRVVAEDVALVIAPRPASPDEDATEADEPSSGGGSGWRVELPSIALRRASVAIRTGEEPMTFEAIDATASVTLAPSGEVSAAGNVDARWRERDAQVRARIVGKLGERIEVSEAEVSLAGARLGANEVAITMADGAVAVSGHVVLDATPRSIAQLVPGVELPAPVHAEITARTRGDDTALSIAGRLGEAPLGVLAIADARRREARGLVWSHGAALAPLTDGRVEGTATAAVAFVASPERVRGTITARGEAVTVGSGPGAEADATAVPDATAFVALDASVPERRAQGLVLAAGAGALRVGVVGAARDEDGRLVVERTHVGASTGDASAASGGLVPVTGHVGTELVADGPLDALAIRGTLRGRRLRVDDVRAARLDGRYAGTLADVLAGSAHVALAGVTRAGEPLGAVTVDARTRRDGTIATTVRARGAQVPVSLDLDAVVAPGEVLEVALGRHRIATPSGSWRGRGGHVRVEPEQIVVRGVRSSLARPGQPAARVGVDARLQRATGALSAEIAASDLPAAALDPTYRGTAHAQLRVTRRGTRWAGEGTVRAEGLALGDDVHALDGEARVTIAGRRIALEGRAENAEVGAAQLAVEVEGPRDITDVAAWRRVPRQAVRSLALRLARVDAAALTEGATRGVIDGTLVIQDGAPSGTLAVRDVDTPAGPADADVELAERDPGLVDVEARARVGALGEATLGARLRVPAHPFDPRAWAQLGSSVLDSARARAEDVAFDPQLLAKLGIELPYRGRATLDATVATGGRSAQLALDVRGVQGGELVRPVDAHVEARADARETTASVRVGSGELVLVSIPEARTPVSLDRWLAAPARALAAPITASVEVPRAPVRDVLAIVGRSEATHGALEGEIAIGGTLASPTVRGAIELADVRVRPRIAGRPSPQLTALRVEGRWADGRGQLRVTGTEGEKGSLLVEAAGRTDQLASALATVKIDDFDLAPVAAFLPGQLVAASGKLDADLTLRGLDLETGTLRGRIQLADGRVPIAPAVGTLRRADASIVIDDAGVTAKLSGRIGAGAIELAGKTDLDGTTLRFSGELSRFSPIGSVQPVIDGKITGTLRRRGSRFIGEATISEASVLVPEQTGTPLLDEAAPGDLIFVDGALPLPTKRPPRAPSRPWLVVDVDIEPVLIRVPDFAVDARAGGSLRVAVGDSLGLSGEIVVESGRAEVFGHRYRVDVGRVAFDGTTDPFVDVKLAHDFRDDTMFVRYAGRVSEIGEKEPELSSSNGIYSQGQLFGFFLGGEPGGDPSKQTSAAAANFGAALASTTFGRQLKKVIPVDVLRCDLGSDVSSRSCTIGKWLNPKTFLSYRHKLEARQDENTGDAKVEYYWKPNLILEGTGGDRRFFGLDLLWRRRL